MSNDERSVFYEFKAFLDHIENCFECQRKLSLDDIYREVMVHAEQTGSDEMQKEEIKHSEKLMEV